MSFVAELFDAGEFRRRIDPVVSHQLGIQIDLEELIQYGDRHDEDVGDSRLDRSLHLFDEFFQKSLDCRIVRVDIEQVRKIR